MPGMTWKFWRDPLVLKEIRTRMRARTILIVENLYILAFCLIVFVRFLQAGNLESVMGAALGEAVFRTITYTQMWLILFVSPLVAASAVTSEREEKTFDSLWVTPMTEGRVVWAKLLAAVGCFIMLILVSLPLVSICFILGGVGPSDIGKVYGLTLLCAVVAGAMGIYWSTRFQRSIASIPAAAISVVAVVIVGPILAEMGLVSLALISPQVFLGGIYEDVELGFFGFHPPFWLPSVVLLCLCGIYMGVAATVRLKRPQERRYVLLRSIGFLFFVCAALFLAGERVGTCEKPGEARECLANILGTLFGILAPLAPWIGANMPVTRSERFAPVSNAFQRAIRNILVNGGSFMAMLVMVVGGCLALAMYVVGAIGISRWAVVAACFGSLGMCVLTWTLLAAWLADRKTPRGRFIGMAVAYALMGLCVIGPVAVGGIYTAVAGEGKLPVGLQYGTLTSPFMSIACLVDARSLADEFPVVLKALGRYAPIVIPACVYTFTTLALLVVAVIRRFRKRAGTAPGPSL